MDDQQHNQDSWAHRAAVSFYGQFSSRKQLEVIERLDDRDLSRFMILQMTEIQHELRRTRKYAFLIALPIMISLAIFIFYLFVAVVTGVSH
jgi:hypothetical protein